MGFDDNLTIKLHPNDNVAIAFKDIAKEETTRKIKANIHIPQGHKIALKKISSPVGIISQFFSFVILLIFESNILKLNSSKFDKILTI